MKPSLKEINIVYPCHIVDIMYRGQTSIIENILTQVLDETTDYEIIEGVGASICERNVNRVVITSSCDDVQKRQIIIQNIRKQLNQSNIEIIRFNWHIAMHKNFV